MLREELCGFNVGLCWCAIGMDYMLKLIFDSKLLCLAQILKELAD